jgi:hypothetical protein
MKTLKYLVAASLTVGLLGSAFAADPAVKKASSGICHDSSSPNFGQIKDFQPYKTLDACVKSGGTLPAVKPSAATPAAPAAAPAATTPAKPATPATPATPAKPAAAEKAPATTATPAPAAKGAPAGQVKKSSSGICHEPGSEYYDRTKDFEPFKTMADCVKSGGRAPK